MGRALEWLLVGSQDVAHDMHTLRQLGVTHILNVAYGMPNAFPNVRLYETILIRCRWTSHVYSSLMMLQWSSILLYQGNTVMSSTIQDFTYLTVSMYDDPSETFTTHYQQCRQFIEQARASSGTVLVHW